LEAGPGGKDGLAAADIVMKASKQDVGTVITQDHLKKYVPVQAK